MWVLTIIKGTEGMGTGGFGGELQEQRAVILSVVKLIQDTYTPGMVPVLVGMEDDEDGWLLWALPPEEDIAVRNGQHQTLSGIECCQRLLLLTLGTADLSVPNGTQSFNSYMQNG